MNYSQGSVWRRWDLHVHTPGTLKNDQFGYDKPINEVVGEHIEIPPEKILELKWEKFYSEIEKYIGDGSDLNRAIEVIGITDYNSVENYKRVISDKKLPNTIKMVIPNIEMRLSLISGKSPVNIHFLFDPSITVESIEDRFLARLKFTYGSSTYSATKSELIRLGQCIDSSADKVHAYRLGAEQYLVDLISLQNLFQEDIDLRNHVLVFVANSGEDGISGFGKKRGKSNQEDSIEVQRQTSTMRESVYKFVDGLFTSNPSDVSHFLGTDGKISPDEVIRTFGSLKPCIHGSDAHCLDRLFEPDEKRYCWIKADPTFEGLKQILYEPGERVYIGSESPDIKDSHYVIKSVKFEDEKFQQNEIVFNPNLNCIIGGKSTGKTLLLRNMAKAIDPDYVNKQIKSLHETRTPLEVVLPLVTWMDGTSEVRKIVYIPQTFLNHSVEDEEGFSAKNDIIKDFLLQKPEIAQQHDKFDQNLSSIHTRTQKAIRSYFNNHRLIKKINDDLLKDGNESTFIAVIKELNTKKDSLAEGADFSPEKWIQFTQMSNQFEVLKKEEETLQTEIEFVNQIKCPKVLVPGIFKETENGYENDFSKSSSLKEQLSSLIADYEMKICFDWKNKIEEFKQKLIAEKQKVLEKKSNLEKDLLPLKKQSETNKALHDVLEAIEKENTKLEIAKSRTNQKGTYLVDLQQSKKDILQSLTSFRNEYENYLKTIKSVDAGRGSSLKIQAYYGFKKDAFNDFLGRSFLKKIQERIKHSIGFDFFNWSEKEYNEDSLKMVFDFLEKDFLDTPDFLHKGEQYENVFLQLFTNWFHIQYDAFLDGDSIAEMSPGKKAAVFLELLIGLTDDKCPILIDQPEDDLDNRSIYHDLVEYIKKKKKERQIIIVTHNANLVVGADAEEVIIANKNVNVNNQRCFEYRSGSIENNSFDTQSSSILFQKGIQSQICDILEGGKNAFEHRKNKYSSVKS